MLRLTVAVVLVCLLWPPEQGQAASYYDGDRSHHNTRIFYHEEPAEFNHGDRTLSQMLQLTKLSQSSYRLQFSTLSNLGHTTTLYDLTAGDYLMTYSFTASRRTNRSGDASISTTWYSADFTFTIDSAGNFSDIREVLPHPAEEYEDDDDYPFYEDFSLSGSSSTIRVNGYMRLQDSDSGNPLHTHNNGTFYRYGANIQLYKANKAPTVTLLQPSGGQVYTDLQDFVIEGYVRDENNDAVHLTSEINYAQRTTTVTGTSALTPFTLDYGTIGGQLGSGQQKVTLRYTDGIASQQLQLTVIILPVLGNNKTIIVNTAVTQPAGDYSDPEGDLLYSEQYHYVHHEHYYENPEGRIPGSGTWRTSPITTFTKPGHYEIRYRARDNPKDDPRFDSLRKWSAPSGVLNVYVHRKPVAQFNKQLTFDESARVFSIAFDPQGSYDPDRRSSANKGIIDYRWSYSQDNGATWLDGQPSTLSNYRHYRFRLVVLDTDGAWSEPYEDTFYTNPGIRPPQAGFSLTPATVYRGGVAQITSTAYHPDGLGLTYAYYIKAATGTESLIATTPDWTYTAAAKTLYTIRQVVTDTNGLSDEFTATLQVANRQPIAEITVPASSSASAPTIFDEESPTLQWTMADLDLDVQQGYELRITRVNNGVVLYQSGTVWNGNQTLTVPGLPEKVTLRAMVRTHDGQAWSAWSGAKYFQIITNEPPQAAFHWSPTPVWEGDTVQLLNDSTDPDGDALTYAWRIRWPDGTETPAASRDVTRKFLQPGNAQVTLTVSDGELQDSVTHTIQVRPLTIAASVWHTELWLDYHHEQGHETDTNPKDFYAGELLQLQAITSPTAVHQVRAWLTAVSEQGHPLTTEVLLATELPSDPTRYTGELYDERWMSLTDGLPEGLQVVRFEVTYANGTIKQADVPITIIGNVLSTSGVHRRR